MYCCDKGIESSSSHWNEGAMDFLVYTPVFNGAMQCPADETRIALDPEGGPDANGNTHSCKVADSSGGSVLTPWFNVDLVFCCKGSTRGAVNQAFPKAV
jgi:chitinase